MTNEEAREQLKDIARSFSREYFHDWREALDVAIKALEQLQDVHDTCNEDYPTCTECEHYDSEKHYCPRFCQVIKDTLAEAQPTEMRDATEEERKSVKDYIKSISKPTGVQFDAQLTDLTAEEKEIIDAIHKMGLFRTNYANDKVSKAVSKIIKAYEAQPTWIPVKDPLNELPKDRMLYVTTKFGDVETLVYDMTEWDDADVARCTVAYMDYYVPEPYKEDAE